ncbi:hypothetical protein B0H14DRAFT_2580577 [Mycena olivaceomarginata]|nr:hypothetical protein B0H14DRAFT_2580577 [Mycena olivaceomarginata]
MAIWGSEDFQEYTTYFAATVTPQQQAQFPPFRPTHHGAVDAAAALGVPTSALEQGLMAAAVGSRVKLEPGSRGARGLRLSQVSVAVGANEEASAIAEQQLVGFLRIYGVSESSRRARGTLAIGFCWRIGFLAFLARQNIFLVKIKYEGLEEVDANLSEYSIASKYFDVASMASKQEITDFSTQRVNFFGIILKCQNEVLDAIDATSKYFDPLIFDFDQKYVLAGQKCQKTNTPTLYVTTSNHKKLHPYDATPRLIYNPDTLEVLGRGTM